MCISEVSRISHTDDAEDYTQYSQDGESDQETEPPFSVLSFVDWIAGQNGEAPDYSEDEIQRQECEEGKSSKYN